MFVCVAVFVGVYERVTRLATKTNLIALTTPLSSSRSWSEG